MLRSWSSPAPTPLPNPNAKVAMTQLAPGHSGRRFGPGSVGPPERAVLALAYNPSETKRRMQRAFWIEQASKLACCKVIGRQDAWLAERVRLTKMVWAQEHRYTWRYRRREAIRLPMWRRSKPMPKETSRDRRRSLGRRRTARRPCSWATAAGVTRNAN